MASNRYINVFNAKNEQGLIENLIVESLRFYAHDVEYLPRTAINLDKIFNENEHSNFSEHYPVEVYIKNVDNYNGDGEFLSKFGLEIRHQMVLIMSFRSFDEFVTPSTGFARPREGDLFYIPMLNSVFEIRFVEPNATFFQLGTLQTYEITVERFEYSNEIFSTGIDGLDDIYNAESTVTNIDNDPFNQNEEVQETANTIIDWDESNPFGENL